MMGQVVSRPWSSEGGSTLIVRPEVHERGGDRGRTELGALDDAHGAERRGA